MEIVIRHSEKESLTVYKHSAKKELLIRRTYVEKFVKSFSFVAVHLRFLNCFELC
jgi:hypothetical protein